MSHPNKAHFTGILTRLDEPSTRSPAGARGHNVVLLSSAAREALPSLIGMGISVDSDFDRHRADHKVGVIESAHIDEKDLVVAGYLWKLDAPEVVKRIEACAEPLGMSYELHDAHVDDLRADIWVLSKVTFAGAAILLKEKAAYEMTKFVLL